MSWLCARLAPEGHIAMVVAMKGFEPLKYPFPFAPGRCKVLSCEGPEIRSLGRSLDSIQIIEEVTDIELRTGYLTTEMTLAGVLRGRKGNIRVSAAQEPR